MKRKKHTEHTSQLFKMFSTRSQSRIYLIGEPCTQILGAKLPSKMQALSLLFGIYSDRRLELRACAAIVVNEVCNFWDKAYIPTQRKDKCIDKLLSLHTKWQTLFKHKNRESAAHKNVEKAFLEDLEELFDIAAANAMDVLTHDADKQFLMQQREKSRQGAISGVDAVAMRKEKKKLERIEAEAQRRRKSHEVIASTSATVHTNTEHIMDETDTDDDIQMDEPVGTDTDMDVVNYDADANIVLSPQRGVVHFINEKIVSVLDKCKVSDRDAIHLLIAVAEALGHNVQQLIINRTSLQKARKSHRESIATKLKDNYKLNPNVPCIVHFDGKLLPNIHGKLKVDRLPVIVSNKNGDQLLGIPSLRNGTSQEICAAVFDTITEWGLAQNIQAISCDTTASNTGRLNGACMLLQQRIGRNLMVLPCRHHIYEIILKAVFDKKMGTTSAPIVLLFKRFQAKWGT